MVRRIGSSWVAQIVLVPSSSKRNVFWLFLCVFSMLCVMVKGQNLITGECTRSKLWLVDLAGSERVAKTDVQGDRLKEAQCINKSLSALGDVIAALTTKSSHVPFRSAVLALPILKQSHTLVLTEPVSR